MLHAANGDSLINDLTSISINYSPMEARMIGSSFSFSSQPDKTRFEFAFQSFQFIKEEVMSDIVHTVDNESSSCPAVIRCIVV